MACGGGRAEDRGSAGDVTQAALLILGDQTQAGGLGAGGLELAGRRGAGRLFQNEGRI